MSVEASNEPIRHVCERCRKFFNEEHQGGCLRIPNDEVVAKEMPHYDKYWICSGCIKGVLNEIRFVGGIG